MKIEWGLFVRRSNLLWTVAPGVALCKSVYQILSFVYLFAYNSSIDLVHPLSRDISRPRTWSCPLLAHCASPTVQWWIMRLRHCDLLQTCRDRDSSNNFTSVMLSRWSQLICTPLTLSAIIGRTSFQSR